MTETEANTVVAGLYRSFYATVVRYAWRAVGSLQLAEDLVQQTFLDLYVALRKGKTIENPQAWVFCVARRGIKRQARAAFDP